MSARRSKKNQRLGSSRRGLKGLNKNIEKDDIDDDDGFHQTVESDDGQIKFPTSDYHSAQFDHPPSSSIDHQTSVLECPPLARSHKDSLMETELPEQKRKMGSNRKSAGGFKVERKLEARTTEELDEYVTQPNTSATEEQHSTLIEDEQSWSSFPSNSSLQTESSGLGGEPQAPLMVVVSDIEEKDAIYHQEITSYSNQVVSDTSVGKATGRFVHSGEATVADSDFLREDSVMFSKLKTLHQQETPLASTSGQKKRMGSTRRPLRGKNNENVGVQEHSRSMTENEREAEVADEAKFNMSEEMVQMCYDVARDDPLSHAEPSLVSNQSLLAERANLKESDVLARTETMNQSVAFPLVDPEKPSSETSSHHGAPLLNKGLDFKCGSHTEDFDVLNRILEEAGSQHVSDIRTDTSISHDCRDENTVEDKEEVLKQKEEPPRNNKTSSLIPRQVAQLEELELNCEESPSLSQHNNFEHTIAQFVEGGNRSFDVPASNIKHAEPTATNLPHEMDDAVKESQEICVEVKHEYNVCDIAPITCDTRTDLECADEDERGSETDNGFEITDQGDARDHIVTQIIMEAKNNKEDGGTSTETVWISHQEPREVSTERDFSSTISQTQSGPPYDNAGNMLENKVREDKEEYENTVINNVTSKSEEMLRFEDSATETGSLAHQQLFLQSPDNGYDLSESGYEESENEGIIFSAESENVAFDRSVGRSEETEGIKGTDVAVLMLDVEKPLTDVNTVCNYSESYLQRENPDQNRVLTEEQNNTNPEAFQVSDSVSTVIDSSPLLNVVMGSEETEAVAEESDIRPVIPESSQDSYKLTTLHSETQGNEEDVEILPVEGDTDLDIQTQKTFHSSTSEAVGTEQKIHDVSVLEFDVNGDTITVESNRTTECEALKVSENPKNEVSNDINIIHEYSHKEEGHTKSSPVVYKRKMGSTRRPLREDTGQRKRREYHDENETLDSETMTNVEKETFSLEESSPYESMLQSSKQGDKEQEIEISEKKDVGPAEESESALIQSSCISDSVSEESTAVSICDMAESQTLTKTNEESQENSGDAEIVFTEGDAESHSEISTEIQLTDLTKSEAEITEEKIYDATVSLGETEFIVDTVTVESNMTESDLLQNDTFTDVTLKALKVSVYTETVSSVTDTGLLVQDNTTEESGQTDTVPAGSDTNIIPDDSHSEAAHSKSSPVVHKRKMGSTRRPLKGNKGQRKEIKYDENETLDSETMTNVEKETFSLEDEPRPDESTTQSSKYGDKEQEMKISEKNDVSPAEESESALIQSSCISDSVSEESTTVSVCHITESQTLSKTNEESQEIVSTEGDAESHSEIQRENKAIDLTSEVERTEENICEATVLITEVEVFGPTVTVDSDVTTDSDFHQNAPSPVANMAELKASENVENKVSEESDKIPESNDTKIIPDGSHVAEVYAKQNPVVHKRKMGSTRRPLKGNKGQRKGIKYDENETLDSETMINVEKETFSLEESSPYESMLQSSKYGDKEQEMEICEKNDVGPAEESESALMQSSCISDSVSEESTVVSICHITESKTLSKTNEESQENTGDAERVSAEGDTESHSEIQRENKTIVSTTSEVERSEENICEATVLVTEVEVFGPTVTVDSDVTTDSDFHQNAPSPVADMAELKVSENVENKVSEESDKIPESNDTNIIPDGSHVAEVYTKQNPVVHKRKMGSTRRPLKGNKGQRKGIKYDENETLDSETMISVEKETFSLEEFSTYESTLQSSKYGDKEQEMEICEKNDVGPAEESESALMQSSCISDSVSEESTAVSVCHITESQTLSKTSEESQENTGDAEIVSAEGDTESHSEIQRENKAIDLTSEAEGTEENICDASVLVTEVEVFGPTVTVDSDVTTDSDFLQNAPSPVADMAELKVSENVENKVSEESDKITEPNDSNIIPEGSHVAEVYAKQNPVVHKRKMGSTRRPLKGNKGQRKGLKYDENETLDSETVINVKKETFSLEDEPRPDDSTSQSSKYGDKEQEIEICEKNDVGPAEESESALIQSSCISDSVSEESTAVSVCHITESQTLSKTNEESQENTGDAEIVSAEGDTESHSEIQKENKMTVSATSEAAGTAEKICDATVSVREVEFTVDTVTVESNMTESDLLQNDTFTDVTLKLSEYNETVSFETDTGLLVQDNTTEESGQTDTVPAGSDTNIIPDDSHSEAAHSKLSPVVHKRKMGSTRRPLKGNKGQRKEIKYDENETLDSETVINVEKETFSLEDEPSPDESTTQSSKYGDKEQEMKISEKNDVGPAEESESALIQSSCISDSVSEESTTVSVCHITESQTLSKTNEESQEIVSTEGDAESHSEIQRENKVIDLTSEAERTEENICEATVLITEVEVFRPTVTVDSDVTTDSDFHQNAPSPVADMAELKVSENVENKVSEESDKIPESNDTNIIPDGSHVAEVYTKQNPVVHKRKMGSTRRPLKGNKGQRKGIKYDENETLDSETMINVEKETFSLEDEPRPDDSTSQSSKDGDKEQEMEICEKKDVGPAEESESALMQSSCISDSVSEESTAVSICDMAESQTLTKTNEESQENTGDAERVSAEGDTESHSEIQRENKMTVSATSEAAGTAEKICDATVSVREVEFTVDTVTVESNMTESDLLQNDTFTDVTLKLSEYNENVSSVTDTGLLVQDNTTEESGQTDTVPAGSDTNIIPDDSHSEAAHSKLSPVVHKRKMGSTRRPLKVNKGQRKGIKYDENETLDSETMTNVEKETFSLEDEPSPDESTSEISKDAQKLTDGKMHTLKVSEYTKTGLVQDDATKEYIDMTTESVLHQNASSPDVHVKDLKLSENVENKDTITEPSDINIIPEGSHGEEVHAKLSPVVHKRKIGSTRRPLRGNKDQGKVRVVSGEDNPEIHLEIHDQDNGVEHNVTQVVMNLREDEDEERMTTIVGVSMQLCADLEQVQRSDISQTQTGPSKDDFDSHLLEVSKGTADFVRENLTSHSDLVLSDSLLMEESQICVSSENVVMSDTCVPPTEVAEMHSVSNRSLQKRKIGSTRKRGRRMVNEEEVEDKKEVEAEDTTLDDGTTKSEDKLTLEEDITGSPVYQQAFSSSAGKEGQDVASKSDVQTKHSEQYDQNQVAEIVLDLPLEDVETYSVPEKHEIITIIPEESHRQDVQSNLIPVQKRKMGSTRKTLRGNKGQRREEEPQKMDGESKGEEKEQDTDPHLTIIEGKNKCKLDEDVEKNIPVEFPHQSAISNMFSESEDGVKEVSLNIHDPSEVDEEKKMENTVNDCNSPNEAINLNEGAMDRFVLTVSREDVYQIMSANDLDQNVHGGSDPEHTETMCHVFPTQELKNTQDDVVHENSSQKMPSTKVKRRKMGSTRRNPQVMHGENTGDQDDELAMAMDRETKKAEDDLDDRPLASSISKPREISEAQGNTDLESEMFVGTTDLKRGDNDYKNNSDPSGLTEPETLENTLQICENQLASADVTKHLQPETVKVEKRRKMGSTRKNITEGRTRGKRDAYEDMETADTHLKMSQDSEMSLAGTVVGEHAIHDYSNQSEDSLLSEIERALNKTCQSSLNYELTVNEPNSGVLANAPYLNKPENSEIQSLQPQPSQTSKTHSEPNLPERRVRKMGSTRKNPRQQLKAEREDEDKEDEEINENLEAVKQALKNLERVEVSVEQNIPENKPNKEYLDVPSAHTSSSQLEESDNPVLQERTSPSTKRKFGSRRTNKGKQGLGRLNASDSKSELEDKVEENLRNDDLTVCEQYISLQPENQPISQPISEQSNMEARNEEAAPKGTGAGLVSLDQIIKLDRSTGIHSKNRSEQNSEEQFNVVMAGNSCVGKTSFIRRFHEGQFTQDYRSTIGVDTCVQTVVLPDRTVKLQIWDTAGQERFNSITRQVFHKADGLLLMYDITCSKSFISVRDWIAQARERAPDDAIMILLGNKNDSVDRKVQILKGEELAREYNIHFMECSAATGANVSESMRALAELLMQRKTRKEEHTTLRKEPPPKKSGCC